MRHFMTAHWPFVTLKVMSEELGDAKKFRAENFRLQIVRVGVNYLVIETGYKILNKLRKSMG